MHGIHLNLVASQKFLVVDGEQHHRNYNTITLFRRVEDDEKLKIVGKETVWV